MKIEEAERKRRYGQNREDGEGVSERKSRQGIEARIPLDLDHRIRTLAFLPLPRLSRFVSLRRVAVLFQSQTLSSEEAMRGHLPRKKNNPKT